MRTPRSLVAMPIRPGHAPAIPGRRRLCAAAVLVLLAVANALAHDLPDFQPLRDGLQYYHDRRPDGPLSIHVLRIDREPGRWNLHTALGQGTVYGLEPLDAIVRRTSLELAQQPGAAINGDFFVIQSGPYQGDPRGIQIIRSQLVSAPAGRSFWITAAGEPRIGTVESRLRIIWPDGTTATPIGLNQERSDDAIVLFTPALGLRPGPTPARLPSTRTQGGRELLLGMCPDQPWGPIRIGQTYEARIGEIRESGDTPLAYSWAVLSLGPKTLDRVPAVRVGERLRLVVQTHPDLSGAPVAIGVGRILLDKGKTPELGAPSQPRHPRSIIGWNEQYWFLFVVDGRQPSLSIGMTYPEMSALARQYGCQNAAELDGGGSSTLWAAGKVLNSPSDGHIRPIANALIFFRQPPANTR